MIIRKKFSVESAHIVRNCTSERCSHSIHGHSAVIELFFESSKLDNAQMVMDFGLMKKSIKQFVDSMDHCYILCKHDDEEFKTFIKNSCDRYIELPFNPSAEMLSTFIMAGVNYIIDHTEFNNGESGVRCISVRYHETASGYAQCNQQDVNNFIGDMKWNEIEFSEGVRNDWDDDLINCIDRAKNIINPIITQQINL